MYPGDRIVQMPISHRMATTCLNLSLEDLILGVSNGSECARKRCHHNGKRSINTTRTELALEYS
ncbi:unnamed protein product [Lactuca virosa]|uniref:Uncharacterized protein n=1 Tax=Lactuca virosa TaxID=75947 RepID=A0AAU9NZK6_9ASTR|nr:unnamed protein product [Lactuca virosa]